MPVVDFESKRKQKEELQEEFVRKSSKFGMIPERTRKIWPYLDRSV